MTFNYVLQDNQGNVGQSIPLIQGESRTITAWLSGSNGAPIPVASLSEIVVKVFSQINQASIVKKLSLSQVTQIQLSGISGYNLAGFQFTLSAADTASMAANNSGLPMKAVVTVGTDTLEFDFAAAFNVSTPVVTT